MLFGSSSESARHNLDLCSDWKPHCGRSFTPTKICRDHFKGSLSRHFVKSSVAIFFSSWTGLHIHKVTDQKLQSMYTNVMTGVEVYCLQVKSRPNSTLLISSILTVGYGWGEQGKQARVFKMGPGIERSWIQISHAVFKRLLRVPD